MVNDFKSVTVEIKINEKSCPVGCEGCPFTGGESEIITKIPENIKKSFELIYNKGFESSAVKIGEEILLLSNNIDLSVFKGVNKIDFSSHLTYEIIDITKEKLLKILTNKHNKNIFKYVGISYMNRNTLNIDSFEYLMDKTINNSKYILGKINNLNRLQNIYGSNDINKKNQYEIFDKSFEYFLNYFKLIKSNTSDLSFSKRDFGVFFNIYEETINGELEIIGRYLNSEINKTIKTEKTLRKLFYSDKVIISLFRSFVMIQHSVGTVNDKNLQLDYETFNKIISENGNFKELLIYNIIKKLEN